MTTAEPDALYASALGWVNKIRADYRQPKLTELPKGLKVSQSHCTLARALPSPAQVGLGQYKIFTGPWVKMPKRVADFYRKFDAGEYPYLVETT